MSNSSVSMLFVSLKEKFTVEPLYNGQVLLSVIRRCPLHGGSIRIVVIMYISKLVSYWECGSLLNFVHSHDGYRTCACMKVYVFFQFSLNACYKI